MALFICFASPYCHTARDQRYSRSMTDMQKPFHLLAQKVGDFHYEVFLPSSRSSCLSRHGTPSSNQVLKYLSVQFYEVLMNNMLPASSIISDRCHVFLAINSGSSPKKKLVRSGRLLLHGVCCSSYLPWESSLSNSS